MITTEPYECIMLAAGESTRMGSWKMLLPFGGSTVIERSVREALRFCPRIVLVVGHRGDELAAMFRGRNDVETVVNRDFRSGQFSSVRTGMTRIRGSRFFITLGDMPLIRGDVYAAIAGAGRDAFDDGCEAIRPSYRGRPGHPVLLDRERVFRGLSEEGIRSMRDILRERRVLDVSCDDPGVVADIDTPSDYAALLRDETPIRRSPRCLRG